MFPYSPPGPEDGVPHHGGVSGKRTHQKPASVPGVTPVGVTGPRLAQLGIIGTEGMTDDQIADELRRGGKFVVFQYCISVFVVTVLSRTQVYFLHPGQSAGKYSVKYT